MSLSKVSPSNRIKEKKSLDEIFNAIDTGKSVIFNSGAGAGKTYALIESLKYIIRHKAKNLKKHNQEIVCITYTNVATEEVKERLGNTDLVLVSTIHERIWGFIKDYQKELVEIHKLKLESEILILHENLRTGKDYEKYQELEAKEKEEFKKIMIKNKDLFFKNYSGKAAEVKKAFEQLLIGYPNLLRNIGNFKRIVNTIYKLDQYTRCHENIILKKPGYKTVEYNSIFNNDQIHKMRISHNTVLDYALKIIKKYDLLKQIIIDKYPFIFIDEYQDTDTKVVLIMNYLEQYAKKINHDIFIGYFGDVVQNIYGDGVGSEIIRIHSGLKPINKRFNRRSRREIIEVINKIRNDGMEQVSIYDDCAGGSVKFYKGKPEHVRCLIDKYIYEWEISKNNPLHCLVLTNKDVAKYSGFENIYEYFKDTDKYSGRNYNQLNTELLSNDLSKLGEIPKLLFNIIKLRDDIDNKATSIIDISPKESLFDGMSMKELRNLILLLKQHKGKTLGEYVESISIVYSKVNNENYKKLIDWTFGFENVTVELFKNYLIKNLFNNILEENIDRLSGNVQGMLNIDIFEYELWYKFILNKQEEKVIYHTYHGTKGTEFENVLIIMENAFGRDKNYFNFFFENNLNPDRLKDEKKLEFEKIKNLLYVSCSRAIENLRIIYIDDVSNFESGIKEVFGKIHLFSEN